MFLIGRLLLAVATVLDIALEVYMWVIVARALISWVVTDITNPLVRLLHSATEPVLRPMRKLLGAGVGVDISPVIAVLGILFVRYFLIVELRGLALGMR